MERLSEIANPDAVSRQAIQQVAQVADLLAEFQAREAIAAGQAASATLAGLQQALERYSLLKQGLATGRADLEQLLTQGYRVETSSEALDNLEQLLGEAVGALQEGGPPAAEDELERGEAALERATTYGRRLPEIRASNDARLQASMQVGNDLAALIGQGRQTFDLVDEFAESTWSDIRGNGSESQQAADRAQTFWQNAARRNTMEAQEFVAAQEDLDAADKEVAFARQLIEGIMQRLKDLERAREIARAELESTLQDIALGWTYVRANDLDIDQLPEQKLRRAEELLAAAQAEIEQAKPDWLQLIKQAQEANSLADAALAEARSEVETIQKLRAEVERTRELATAEVQKVVNFAGLHQGDLKRPSAQAVAALQSQVQEAFAALKQVDALEDTARLEALRRTQELYRRLQDGSGEAYKLAYADFQKGEELRKQVAEIMQPASEAYERAQRNYQSYSHLVSKRSNVKELLARAGEALNGIGSITDEDDLRRATKIARQVKQDAEAADDAIMDAYRRYQRDHQGPNFPSGPIIIGGGFGGSSGGSSGWGTGGSSGGSWGGGSSGGSWGGDSSGGGW